MTSAAHPNILVIWCDELRHDCMAATGNPRVRTPNLDALAARSVLFQQAYVTQPVCTPSRSSVLTGLWPHQSGCIANNLPLPAGVPTMAEMLPVGTYDTAYFGKWHLGDELNAQHGFAEWISIEDNYRPYYRDDADRGRPCDYSRWLMAKGFIPNKREANAFDRWFPSCLPNQYSKPTFLAERSEEYLLRKRVRPFFLHVNFLEPHSPINGPYNDRLDPAAEPRPANFGPDAYAVPPRYQERQKAGAMTWAEQAVVSARYWGLVEQIDESLGRILRALRQSGQEDNTLIVFTSDHGNCLGSHGIMYKTVMYEESVRVPLLLSLPGGAQAGTRVTGPVSHIDLVPTLLDHAGFQVPANLPGRSLRGRIDGSEAPGDVLIQWHPVPTDLGLDAGNGGTPDDTPERCLVGADGWKYVWRPDGTPTLLVDLTNDPHELQDRSQDPAVTARLASARERLANRCQHLGDTALARGAAASVSGSGRS